MRIIFRKNQLNKALSILSKATTNKVSSNLTSAILITTKTNMVEMEANDFELGIRIQLEAEIIEEGMIAIPSSKTFIDIVKFSGDTIELIKKEHENQVIIKSGRSEYKINTHNVDDFNFIEEIKEEYTFTMDTLLLKELIDMTTYAVAVDESRPIYTGALLEIANTEISMVGTNTHRMSIKKIIMDESLELTINQIIPAKILNEIARLLPVDTPQMVKISGNQNKIAFFFDNVYMTSRLIEGEFPNYKAIIPQSFYSSATVDCKSMLNAIERVSLLTNDDTYRIINFAWSSDEVLLTSKNLQLGSAKENIPCHYEGTDYAVSYNGRYITDVLKHANCDKVYFYFTEKGILLIRLENNPNYIYIVTPMRSNV